MAGCLQMLACLMSLSNLQNRVQLLHASQVPHTFQEVSIQSGYRKPCCSLLDCLISAFAPLNNETVNFWTHFVPFWFFAWTLKQFWNADGFASDPYHWPFLAYQVTMCAWPIASCMAHLFCVMSEETRHLCFFFDYLSLSWYSFGVSIVYHAYSFERHFFDSPLSDWYPYATAAAALLCTTLSCYSRLMAKEGWLRRKAVRSLGFTIPYAIVSLPLLHRIYMCRSGQLSCSNKAINGHTKQFLSTAVGFALYNLHLPERLWPGTFDLVGHSHQLFHVCGVLSSYFQLWAVAEDMKGRRDFFERVAHPAVGRLGAVDVCMVLGVLLANCVIVAHYCRKLKANKKEN